MIEEITGMDVQGKKIQGQDLTSPVPVGADLPRVLASYPVICSDNASSSKCSKGSKEGRWISIGMNDLKKLSKQYYLMAYIPHLLRRWLRCGLLSIRPFHRTSFN